MKKFLLSLATVLCASAFASADEVTIQLNASTGFTGDKNAWTASTDGFTFKYEKAGSSSDLIAPSADHIRIYKNATFTVTGDNGQKITKMVMTSTGTKYCGLNSATAGTGSWSGTTYTWTGDANTVTFTAGDAQTRIKNVTITYTPAGGVVVDAPEISPKGGKFTEAQTVTITAGSGSTIYYTTDGQTPTDDVTDGSTIKYTAPFTVDKTTTVKAIAFDADDNKSNVVTETYEIVELISGAEGDGTIDNPYNAVAAINEANMGSTAEVYVKGTVVSITELSTQYGNATYYISADGTETNQFYIYRGLNLGGEKFTAEDQLKVGDKVVLFGKLTTYNGTPQLAQNNKIVSINGEEPEPIVLEGEGTEEKPFTVADVIAINPTDSNNPSAEYPDKYWVKGYIVGACNGQSFEFVSTGITSKTNIVIAPTPDTTDAALCIPVQLPTTGTIRADLNLVDHADYVGKQVNVYGNLLKYFSNPGVKNTGDYKLDTSGVEGIEIDANAPVEYYNLQGVRVEKPANGLYIMRQGDKVVKVIK